MALPKKLTLTRNYREGGPPPGGGGGMLYPGTYRVPQDVSLDMAERIVRAGAGTIEDADEPTAKPRGKKPAGEDKALGRAPENKSSLDG